VRQHKAVVRAIRAQDADEAERAITAHLLYLSKQFTNHAG
jgi:DNA-binding GntR family transcriptional regulator